jgi:tetratricopeptide (TPR) repeat protein
MLLFNRAIEFCAEDRQSDAEPLLREALHLKPNHSESRIALAQVLTAKAGKLGLSENELDEKISVLEEIVSIAPNSYQIIYHLLIAITLKSRALYKANNVIDLNINIEKSLNYVDIISENIEVSDAESVMKLLSEGAMYFYLVGRANEALKIIEIALQIDPTRQWVHQSRMLAALYSKSYAIAWNKSRWKAFRECGDMGVWDGETTGGSLEIRNSNGFGDLFQFCRYIPLVADKFAKIYLSNEMHDSEKFRHQLTKIMSLSPGFEKIQVIKFEKMKTSAEYYIELFGLPFATAMGPRDFNPGFPYLAIDPDLVLRWSALIRKPGKLAVGVAWSAHGVYDKRSIGLDRFATLFSISPHIEFFSVQNNDEREQMRSFNMPPNLFDFGTLDAENSAAIMKCMDVVILPDGGLAHLAGAIGANCWVYLRHFCEWRWLQDEDHSDWYPKTRLFRQTIEGDWGPVLDQLAAALLERAASCR